jgi:TonB family protein
MNFAAGGRFVTSAWMSSRLPSRYGTSRVLLFLCLTLALAAGVISSVRAQESTARKLLTRVNPKYPEYLKAHEIGGVVRLMVVVTPNGTVKSVSPVGGNPILVDAATDAVKQWKYAPSDSSDTFEVKLDFIPRQ